VEKSVRDRLREVGRRGQKGGKAGRGEQEWNTRCAGKLWSASIRIAAEQGNFVPRTTTKTAYDRWDAGQSRKERSGRRKFPSALRCKEGSMSWILRVEDCRAWMKGSRFGSLGGELNYVSSEKAKKNAASIEIKASKSTAKTRARTPESARARGKRERS